MKNRSFEMSPRLHVFQRAGVFCTSHQAGKGGSGREEAGGGSAAEEGFSCCRVLDVLLVYIVYDLYNKI